MKLIDFHPFFIEYLGYPPQESNSLNLSLHPFSLWRGVKDIDQLDYNEISKCALGSFNVIYLGAKLKLVINRISADNIDKVKSIIECECASFVENNSEYFAKTLVLFRDVDAYNPSSS
jgi:hypothetical protein